MTKVIFAAIKRHPIEADSKYPARAYELLTIGVGNAPIENDRALRHRLFNKYGEVPDCLILEEVQDPDWQLAKRQWKDVFDQTLVWNPEAKSEPNDVRSQRLAKWWEGVFAEYPLVLGNAEPRPGAAVRLELTNRAIPAHTFLERLARDGVAITTLTAKPGEPLSVGLSGDPTVVAQFMLDLSREGGLLPNATPL